MSITKQKLISLILKKESYKDLKPVITQITKNNMDSIKTSIQAIQEILTKQYNAQSKLYALRFLKDCFQMGSKQFIKLTQQNLLPIIVNIVIQSTDQAAITRYAGSSFTKSTDLTKFKSIIVSFFKLAKQSINKWATWLPNPQFKFKAAFNSLQKKGIKFQSQFKYYRPQNQTNFIKNCRQNGIQIIIEKQQPSIRQNNQIKQPQKSQTKKPVIISKESLKSKQQQQQKQLSESSIIQIQIGRRYGPKGNNKYILKCHQIFKQYDEKLKQGTMRDEDVQIMKSQINSQLEEYMGIPDLNQSQMESQLTPIFQNIKNVTEDYNRFKDKSSMNNLSISSSAIKPKNNTIKKTQQLSNNKKLQPPLSPISKLQTPQDNKDSIVKNLAQDFQNQIKKQKTSALPPKKQEPISIKIIKTQQKKKIQVFDDDSSLLQSQITPPPQKNILKAQVKKQEQIIKSNKKVQKASDESKKVIPTKRESQKNISIQKSSMKDSKKGGTREYFDSHLSISRSQSSRVNFSESSNDQDSNDEDSKISHNFKKQKPQLKLSSIAEEQMEKYGQSSRRNYTESQIPSTLRHNRQSQLEKQRKIVVEKSSLLPSEVKVSKSAIDDYENKIKNLQKHLQEKQKRERQLAIKLNQLNQLKLQQQYELQKIRIQNNKIMQRFSNAVDGQEYGKIKKDFDDMKDRNRKMQDQMDRLLKQIQTLKIVQRNQFVQSHIVIQGSKQNDINYKSKQPNRMLQNKQNLLKQNLNKRSIGPEKPKFTYQPFDENQKRIHFTKIHQVLDQNNLTLLKKNVIGANELFYTSEHLSFIARTSHFKNQRLTLKLELSFQFKQLRKKPIKPIISISNIEQAQVWKKPIQGEQDLFHLEIVVKLKKFPFNLMKVDIQWGENMKKSVFLPLLYWNFLKKGQFEQREFDRIFQNNADSVIKSKVFNLNSKVIKEFKSLSFYQGYSMVNENKMCFKLFEESQKSKVFWCQLTNLSKQKCILKIVPEPFNQEMVIKSQEIMQNILFLVG